jgi:hypothetical protein
MALTKGSKPLSVFLSYSFESKRSYEIVQQLDAFFQPWGVKVIDLQKSQTVKRTPVEEVLVAIRSCGWFIQLFTDHSNDREWMKDEWGFAVAHGITKILAHTSETNLEHHSFNKLMGLGGNLRRVDFSNPRATEDFLYAVLLEAGALGENHGPIQLPVLCQRQSAAERIDVDSVGEFLTNFLASHRKGLAAVFPDRQHAFEARLQDRFRRFSESGGLVRLVGFTLARYVLPPRLMEHTSAGQQVGQFFETAITTKGASAHLLLLDPSSRAAEDRMRIESDGIPPEQSLFFTDFSRVYWHLAQLSAKHEVQTKYYASPYAGLVLFEDEAYVEVYHLGRLAGDRGLCGQVPILVVRKLENPCFYKFFESHFDSLWDVSKQIVVPPPNPFTEARPAADGC